MAKEEGAYHMANNTKNVTPRKDKLYQKQITVGRNSQGVPIRKTGYGKTKKELELSLMP